MRNAKKFNKSSVPPRKKVAVNENSMKRKVNWNEAAAGPSGVGASNDVIHVKHSVKMIPNLERSKKNQIMTLDKIMSFLMIATLKKGSH